MKLVITYDVNVDALEKEYREYLAERKERLEYYEETGDFSRKKRYEERNPWLTFEEFVKTTYHDIEELEDYDLIYNRKMELKNEEEV